MKVVFRCEISKFSMLGFHEIMFIFLLILQFIAAKLISRDSDGYHVKHDVSRNEFSWIALGDWGGRFAPFYTTGEFETFRKLSAYNTDRTTLP